jgi:hypothetical protein
VNITLRWANGHWLIDRRTGCGLGELLDGVLGETEARKHAAEVACPT